MTAPEIRTYGNWRKPTSPGILGLGMAGTLILLGGMVTIIISMMISLMFAIFLTVMLAVVLAPLLYRDRQGRTGLQWLVARGAWSRGKAKGQHLYRSGPLGRVPLGTCKLPGLAAGSKLYEAQDAYQRPFALLTVPSTNDHTVVIECDADGGSLVDTEQVDTWVAYWGQWLAALGNEPGIVAASVTVETALDTGERLRREVFDHLRPDAPNLSKHVLNEVVELYPVGSARVSTRVALTFSGAPRPGVPKRTPEEMATELGTRLPGLCAGLQMTGAGQARPMSGTELAEAVRVAYDPSVAALIDQARSEGGAGITWDDAGPSATQEAWDHYRHDGALSVTWAMSDAPRGEVFSNVLARLLGPHPDIDRKRVTLLYRPHDSSTAANIVERDVKDAMFKAKQAKVGNARDSIAVRAAQQSAQEEATGAGLVKFGMLVTATVEDSDGLDLAASAMDNLSASARIAIRRVYGSQASAFAAALPLGLVLPKHLKVPQTVRDAM
ncbi:hypothetical protein OG948_32870 [Embleya sp. NBC_00888]|uniref:SCO6880 family protein n=1 Tax=Embleya sp. NBC_00888 TaxID=2975960 RepID=UPI0038667A6C|nr:hypothetical protein OG948_32870 [Embleya sp. NBC_00888]